jgi:uncharacterized protein (UPF0333 family)
MIGFITKYKYRIAYGVSLAVALLIISYTFLPVSPDEGFALYFIKFLAAVLCVGIGIYFRGKDITQRHK